MKYVGCCVSVCCVQNTPNLFNGNKTPVDLHINKRPSLYNPEDYFMSEIITLNIWKRDSSKNSNDLLTDCVNFVHYI